MKTSARTPSATSLPRAPREDARSRVTKYMVMMAIRIVCFALMVLVTPYGWYTWVFAVGAVFLPYTDEPEPPVTFTPDEPEPASDAGSEPDTGPGRAERDEPQF